MRLWVDYTNHRGERAWREIENVSLPFTTPYPPHDVDGDTRVKRAMSACVVVRMVDRGGAKRTLRLASIHGFRELSPEVVPVSVPAPEYQRQLDAQRMRIAHLEKAVAEMSRPDTEAVKEPDVSPRPMTGDAPGKVQIPQLARLRHANFERQREWQNGREISLLWRSNELAGEVGEMFGEVVKLVAPMLAFANTVKKIQREADGIRGSRATADDLAREIADVVICADLLAAHVGIDLWEGIVIKFNETSHKNSLRTVLST